MRLNKVIIIIMLLITCGLIKAQNLQDEEIVTNYDIYSKLLDKNFELLEDQFVLLGNDKIFCIKIGAEAGTYDYFNAKARQNLYGFKLISDLESAVSDYIVSFENIRLNTKYKKITGSLIKSRRVERSISISYLFSIKNRISDSLLYKRDVKDTNEDEFSLERIEDVERGGYEFLKGVLPEQSFWEKAFIPGIVTLTSAAAIVLFFVIRSK